VESDNEPGALDGLLLLDLGNTESEESCDRGEDLGAEDRAEVLESALLPCEEAESSGWKQKLHCDDEVGEVSKLRDNSSSSEYCHSD
jgi:hypothetical protein